MAAYEAAGETDEWYTPAYIFDALGVSFNLDVACPPEGPRHVPAEHYFSEGALERGWFGIKRGLRFEAQSGADSISRLVAWSGLASTRLPGELIHYAEKAALAGLSN